MIHWIHSMVWGPGMLVLFLAVGILYTIRLKGFVFWGFPRWWKNTAGSLWKTPEKAGTDEENRKGCLRSSRRVRPWRPPSAQET